jgi:hypothetical protein
LLSQLGERWMIAAQEHFEHRSFKPRQIHRRFSSLSMGTGRVCRHNGITTLTAGRPTFLDWKTALGAYAGKRFGWARHQPSHAQHQDTEEPDKECEPSLTTQVRLAFSTLGTSQLRAPAGDAFDVDSNHDGNDCDEYQKDPGQPAPVRGVHCDPPISSIIGH